MMVLPSFGASSSMLVCCTQRMRCWWSGCGCHLILIMAGAFVGVLRNSHCGKATLATLLTALPASAGTQAQHAAQSRIPLALANSYPAGSPLWHLFNNFYRHALNRVECEWGQPVEIQHE